MKRPLPTLCGLLAIASPASAFAQVATYKAPEGGIHVAQGVQQISGPASNLVTLTAANASGSSADQTSGVVMRGVKVGINCTTVTGTSPTLAVTIQGKDPSGTYFNFLTSASITAPRFTLLTVYPGITVTANVAASDFIPSTWRVSYAIGGTTPAFTCSISQMPK